MNHQVEALVYAAVAVTVVWFLLWWAGPRGTYRKERNPYRRWCVYCGQCQEFTHYVWGNDSSGWWEDVGAIKDPTCKCHKDAVNDR